MSKIKLNNKQQEHHQFTNEFILNEVNEVGYKSKSMNRIIGMRRSEGVNLPKEQNIKFSNIGVSIYPEFLPYIMNLEGCAAKLITYLLLFRVKPNLGVFKWNEEVITEFIRCCQAAKPTKAPYKLETVKKAIRVLVKNNLVCSVERGRYIINPLMAAPNEAVRRQLINDYSKALLKKRKHVDDRFFPMYN